MKGTRRTGLVVLLACLALAGGCHSGKGKAASNSKAASAKGKTSGSIVRSDFGRTK